MSCWQASPGRPKKKLVPISSEKLHIEAKSQILTFNDFFKNFSEGNGKIQLEKLSQQAIREDEMFHSDSMGATDVGDS